MFPFLPRPRFSTVVPHPTSLVLCILLQMVAVSAWSATPRALPDGKLPDDVRLGELKTLNGYFPFTPSDSVEAWEQRAEQLRRQLRVALGLWPMPTRTPLAPVIHGRLEREDYTIEKVYFQSFPGHCVTGNLYRPRGVTGRTPGVLCPHGHWENGRFYDTGPEKIRQQLVSGDERFEQGGRSPLQSRCVQLARMGCTVFHYDMVGYADSKQLNHSPGVRDEMNSPENWGYFSPQAESRLQNMMGLQTYNSICALDFLESLPEVDPERLAVTGASGGGTQTFILCALDPRPRVAFPAVMVSTAMQGGCTCENACYLRVGTGNVEMAALFAPKPLGLTAADDWTREMATKGFPELQQHYALYGKPEHVLLRPLVQFGHNYNYVSRAVMYYWLNRHLELGLKEPIVEEAYERLSSDELTVWNDEHPQPPSGPDYERSLLAWITADSQQRIAELAPHDPASLEEYRHVVGGALAALIQRELPDPATIDSEFLPAEDHDTFRQFTGLLRNRTAGEELPITILLPHDWNQQAAIWIHGQGKAGLFDSAGQPNQATRRLLDQGTAVLGADLLYQGEFLPDQEPLARQRMVGDRGRTNYAGYTYGYNLPLIVERVHDILTLVSWTVHHETEPAAVHLLGTDGAGPWVALAATQVADQVDRVAIDSDGFRFAQIDALDDVNFLPGGAKYGDLPGFLALCAPSPLHVVGEKIEQLNVVSAAYRAAGQAKALTVSDTPESERTTALLESLLQP